MAKTTGNKPIVKYECKDVVLYEKKKLCHCEIDTDNGPSNIPR